MSNEELFLRIEREFKASPEAVYDAWVDPAQLVKWWGPEGMTTPICRLESVEGGHWTTTMEGSGGDRHTSSGVYTKMERPDHLAFTWAWTNDDGSRGLETTVDLTFTKSSVGTMMVLVQGKFDDQTDCTNHTSGWNSSFIDLDKLLAEAVG